jgi:8-oxo-dGTP pyrophosphatase MutT (NUDIX family)
VTVEIPEFFARYFSRFHEEEEIAKFGDLRGLSSAELFHRETMPAHFTASAMVIDARAKATVLVFHRKLGKWLQPGGHADGDVELASVALKEAREETGLSLLELAGDEMFDFGVTAIPAHGSCPAHSHYDVRFLIWGDALERPIPSAETPLVKWIPLDQLQQYTSDSGILRMRDKYRSIRDRDRFWAMRTG